MLVSVRDATADDSALVVALYDEVYGGGYAAAFDRCGAIGPQDFWWVQSEKKLYILEVNRRASGLILLGREGKRLLAEDVLGSSSGATVGVRKLDPTDDALLRRVWQFLLDAFREARQETVLLRATEANPLGLALARAQGFSIVNALRTVVRSEASRPAAKPPDGYTVRRADADDAPEIARIHQEAYGERVKLEDLASRLRKPRTRTWMAERDRFPVAYAHGEKREGLLDLWVAVRDDHRRRGVGMALAGQVISALQTKDAPVRCNHWALDVAAGALARRLGFRSERVHLYFERPI
ncbi:MAG: GNAT family N-acetyltransferase [Armatimonadetes bacterium]|nr:GNAT family N-acetyltransferase [Armatimonadota bacterium]